MAVHTQTPAASALPANPNRQSPVRAQHLMKSTENALNAEMTVTALNTPAIICLTVIFLAATHLCVNV